jgi:hypothetical protein
MKNRCKDIDTIQSEYKENFFKLYEVYFHEEITYELVTRFIDEINAFWHKNKEFLDYEMERLTESNLCLLLSGAIYLDVKESEHYYFKTFGDYHFLPDPFLKLESFFLIPKEEMDLEETLGYFSRALQDTVEILKEYNQHFYFFPMRLMAIENIDEHRKLIDIFYIRFLSTICDHEFQSKEEFISINWNFENIEKKLSNNYERLIFSEDDKNSKTLREKINSYIQSQMNMKILTDGKSESEIFYICLFTWLSQVLDILLICTYLRLQPYIRFSITFHYLTLVMYTFIEDEFIKKMIRKSIIFFVFRKSYNVEKFKKMNFDQYANRTKHKNLLDKIINEMEKDELNIFEGGVKKLEKIISDKLNELI